MEIEGVSVFCVNCGSASGSMVLEDEQVLHCIQQWTAPRLVQAHDLICTTCWAEARAAASTPNVSHIGKECALCHVILPHHARSHQVIALRTDTVQHLNIRNIILERLLPVQVRASHYILCHPCWQWADRAAKHYSTPSTSSSASTTTSKALRCANCRIDLTRLRRHILNNETFLSQIQQCVAPQVVSASDYICDACHTIFNNDTPTLLADSAVLVGHQNVCIRCGHSVAQLRHTIVQSEQNHHILTVVQNWIHPQEIQPSDVICHRCFQRAEAAVQADAFTASNQVPEGSERISLPNYSRALDTHARCLFPACHSTSQQVVPFTDVNCINKHFPKQNILVLMYEIPIIIDVY